MLDTILYFCGKIFDKLFPDKNIAEKAKADLFRLAKEGELKDIELSFKAILAEANSKDPWTSRARPSFLYVMYAFLLFALPIGVLSGFYPDFARRITLGIKAYIDTLPPVMWHTFGVGFVGYSVVRSYDKRYQGGK